jgi:GTPase SAR1 family protein
MVDKIEEEVSTPVSRQKIVFVGDISVGKTSIITRFVDSKYSESYEVRYYLIYFFKEHYFWWLRERRWITACKCGPFGKVSRRLMLLKAFFIIIYLLKMK